MTCFQKAWSGMREVFQRRIWDLIGISIGAMELLKSNDTDSPGGRRICARMVRRIDQSIEIEN